MKVTRVGSSMCTAVEVAVRSLKSVIVGVFASLLQVQQAGAVPPECPNTATLCSFDSVLICDVDTETDAWICDASAGDGDYGASVTAIWDDIDACNFGSGASGPGYCAWGTTTLGQPFCCVLPLSEIPSGLDRIEVYVGDEAGMQDSILFQYTQSDSPYHSFDLDAYTGASHVTAYAFGRGGVDQIWGSDVYSADYHEELDGGADGDVVYGYDGEDILYGQAGDDLLEGGLHDDTISAGTGNDVVRGGGHDDTITGGLGRDLISANAGNDIVDGGGGDDDICGGDGDDTLAGGDDDDQILWGAGANTTDGGPGTDLCYGHAYPYTNPVNCEAGLGPTLGTCP